MTKPKFKQIPTFYFVVYFLGVFNVFASGFLVIFFNFDKFFYKIGLKPIFVFLTLIGISYLLKWSNNLITTNLHQRKINLKKLRLSIIIKLVISSILIFFTIFPFLEIKYDLSNLIFDFLKGMNTSIKLLTLKKLSGYFSILFSFILSNLLAVAQGVIGSIVYDFLIKPIIEKRRNKSQNQGNNTNNEVIPKA